MEFLKQGVSHGSRPPTLFDIYTSVVQWQRQLNIDVVINKLLFADDHVFRARIEEDLRKATQHFVNITSPLELLNEEMHGILC